MQEQNEEDHQYPEHISCHIQEGIAEEKKDSLLCHENISQKLCEPEIPADDNKISQINTVNEGKDKNKSNEQGKEKNQVQKEMLQERKNKDQTNQQSRIKQKNQQIQEKCINQHCNQNDKTSSNEDRDKSLVPRAKTIFKMQISESDYQDSANFRFPLTNPYFNEHMDELAYTTQPIDQRRSKFPTNTFINCDVRYFNWELFTQQVGKFDVMIIDPPWRIKGAQKNDSQFMFSNCKFSLQYNTMSNHEIKQLPLHTISDEGFIFLWILNTQLNSSLEIMQSWGYQLVEQLVWVKLRNQKIYLTHGYYFMHSYQICLVGYKNRRKDGKSMSLRGGLNPNVIFGQVRKKSQKPQDIYTLIEMMFKGKRKIQIFARNHNIRFGIFSVGNQLGQAYDKWMLHLKCDKCESSIAPGTKRFKSKIKDNFDICEICILQTKKQDFFQIANQVDQDVRHQYLSCNHCGVQPIWGIRFQCVTCHDYDLCQSCFDKYLMRKSDNSLQEIHPIDHQFRTLEVPVFGYGFQIHASKCSSCYQNPIVGVCMNCTTCKNFKLCQKCFFQRPRTQETNFSKTHRHDHQFQAIFQEQYLKQKKIQCFNCKKIITQDCWMCENCYNFYFCGECYPKRDKFKSLYANSHKKYHVFAKAF